MKVSHNWLQTYFDKKIPDINKLADLFTFHSFEIEDVEEIKNNIGEIVDTVLDAKVLPDRAHYALSHKGIAEEIAVLNNVSIKKRYADEIPAITNIKPTIKIENTDFCRRYIGRYIEIDSVKDSPQWLVDSLDSIGQRSINSIVDITNYIMYDIGQPLHAFDADKIKGKIIIRKANDGEKITLLDNREIILTSLDNVIADEEGPLVIAGAKGGRRAEINETTRKIIIESANFDPSGVRQTSTKYDIRSDSSKRFENEITPELAVHGMNNACALIKEIIPAVSFGPIVDEYPVKFKKTVIEFNPTYIEERLGIKIPLDEIKRILKNINIVIDQDKKDEYIWHLSIPYERLDLNIREDIVEEVGRIYGYDKIEGILPSKIKHNLTVLPMFYLCEKIRNKLVENGFSEVSLYTLVDKGDFEALKPLTRDKSFARNNLNDGMLISLEKNALNADLLGLEAIKIFEIGHVFDGDIGESIMISIGVAQIKKVKGLKSENILRDTIKLLETDFGIGESMGIFVNNVNLSVCEFNMDKILENYKVEPLYETLDYSPISKNHYKRFSIYPFIVRDIAVFVLESNSNNTSSDDEAQIVWQVIEKGIEISGAKELLVRHSLFDIFKKEGKTSYAFRIVFQSMEKTLTDGEVSPIMAKINSAIKEKGWEVR